MATLVKLTGILPSVAFNLAVPTLFALTVSGVFGVAYNLLGRVRRAGRRLAAAATASWWRRSSWRSSGTWTAWCRWWTGWARTARSTFKSGIPGLEGAVRLVTGLVGHGGPAAAAARPFDYWRSTRVIPNTINEFPFFSFLFADLHAHMIGLPFTILVLALA